MDLGVVIVNYNTVDLLRRCLRTVYASEGLAYCVCVVDNASRDGSAAMVTAEFPRAHLIANVENTGYPAANNQGLRWLGFLDGTSADPPRHALLLNSDTEVPPDAFAKTVGFLDRDPAVGIVGPRLVRPDGSLDLACRRSFPTPEVSAYRMLGLSRLFPRHRRFGQYNLTYLDENQMAEVDSVVGAYMLVRGDCIRKVGGLDEAFFMYGEDLDWAYRIKEAGWKVIYAPSVTVLHVKAASSSQSPRARVEFWRAMDIFYRKHYAATTPWPIHTLITGVLGLRTELERWRARRSH